jgi:hypothetical protein
MFDVFYIGPKPNLFAHEREVSSVEQAQALSRTRYCWIVNYLSDYTNWDFLWEPVPWEQNFTHTWPSQWHEYSGTYLVPKRAGTIEYKFHNEVIPNRESRAGYTQLVEGIDFDYSWAPHPMDPPYNYVFGNQWWPANKMPTVEYRVPGATETKYVFSPRATLRERHDNHWHTLEDCTWDYSWRPDPGDPAYIYVFGNQWHRAEVMPTVEYHVPGATERKYLPFPRAELVADMSRWTIPDNTNLEAFDFSWLPDPGSPAYIYQFGTQWNRAGGPVYTVPGATEIKYTTAQIARMLPTDRNWTIPVGIDVNSFDFSWTPDTTEQPYIYEFGTQWQKTGGPVYTVPGAQETKYINTPRAVKTTKDDCWLVPSGADVESFDWTWHPDATDPAYIYQFGTQHQRTGGPRYCVPGATETKYVDQIKIVTQRVATAIYEIDHLDGNAGQIANTTKTARYFDNYLDTLKRIAKTVPDEHEFVWICSSVCDYTDFDFSWHPEQWQATMLHVFPSDGEKFGDTFFMHVPSFKYRSEKCQLLEWYDLNFTDKNVPRRPLPVIEHTLDTHVEAIQTMSWAGPLAVFTVHNAPTSVPCVPLWREKTKTVVPLSASASSIVVPKVAVPYIKTQVYDYPYIDRTHNNDLPRQLQDIVFISYDEPDADANWEILYNRFPQAKRVHGVVGMEHALEAAADASTTPWYYAVFAKTKLHETFDFSFVPDYMQQPKHYIFNARNTVNGLEYGHMGIVMYNSNGVREQNRQADFGIDYTLSFPHESVPILSCYGNFDQTPYHTWRTAFRESAKLAYFESQTPTVDGAYRLNVWLTVAHGNHAEWSMRGAEDGVEFFGTTRGQLDLLKQSFRWEWLREYFTRKYGNLD